MSEIAKARRDLGWRYRRGLPALLFLPLVLLVLVLAHKSPSLDRYVFELRLESRREVKHLTTGSDVGEVRSALSRPLEEGDPGCWIELTHGRLGRVVRGAVEIISVDPGGRPRTRAHDPHTAVGLASVASPFCWRQTTDERLVTPVDDGVLLLTDYYDGAWARGFQAFGGIFFLFALAGALSGVILRRPAGAEVALAAAAAVVAETVLLLRSVGYDASVFAHALSMHDALGDEYAGLVGFAPLSFLLFMVPAAAGSAGLVVAMFDEVRGVRRCDACLGPSDLMLPRQAPCSHCGSAHAPVRVQWFVVSAACLAAGLALAAMLHFGHALQFFEVCRYDQPTESCREAMGDTEGFLGWGYFAMRGLFEGDPGRIVVFRPAGYIALASVLFVVIPGLIGWRIREGFRTTVAVLPALWITSLVVSFAIVAGGHPYFYVLLVRWHFFGVLWFGLIGFVSATIGLRRRGASQEAILEDLQDDDPDAVVASAAEPGPEPPPASRGPELAMEGLSDELARSLQPSILARHKKKIVGALGLALAAGAALVASRMMPSAEERFVKSAFGKALGDPLTRYCIDMTGPRGAEARSALLSPDVEAQIGPAAADLRSVLDAAAAFQASTGGGDKGVEALFSPIDALDEKLAARGVGGHLSAHVSGRQVWLLSYSVHQREEIKVGALALPIVRGSRLDDLNFSAPLAYRPVKAKWMTISMEAIEARFLKRELWTFTRRPRSAGDAEEASPFASLPPRATDLIVSELVGASKLTKEDALAIDAKVRDRNEWMSKLPNGTYLDHDHLTLSRRVVKRLSSLRDAPIAGEVLKLDDQLRGYQQALVTALDLLADLDEEELAVRALEEERLKDVTVDALEKDRLDVAPMRAAASAELAKLARAQRCPRLALWRTFDRAFGSGFSGREHAVHRLLLTRLFQELGIALPDYFANQEDLANDGIVTALSSAMDRPPADIQAAAGRAYQGIFGQAPPPFTRTVAGR